MTEKAYYSTKELSARLNLSVKWVEKWRHKIAGAKQVGRIWLFDKAMIDARIAKGQDVRIFKNLTAPRCRKYIPSVHGAARSGQKKGDTHGTN